MEEMHRLHKDVTFGWVAWLRDAWTAGARARRERAVAVWADDRAASAPGAWAADPYRLVRSAFGTRM